MIYTQSHWIRQIYSKFRHIFDIVFPAAERLFAAIVKIYFTKLCYLTHYKKHYNIQKPLLKSVKNFGIQLINRDRFMNSWFCLYIMLTS